MASRFWVGGGGSWSQTAHWSAFSGGASGASVPGSTDDVYFNANSNLDGDFSYIDIDISINTLYFNPDVQNSYLDSTGHTFTANSIAQPGGNISLHSCTWNIGSFSAGGDGQGRFQMFNSSTLNLGSSGSTPASPATKAFFNNVSVQNLNFLGQGPVNLYVRLLTATNVSFNSNPKIVTFTNSTAWEAELTLTSLTATGTSGNYIQLGNNTNSLTLKKTTGNVTCDYLKLQNCKATGGANWNAGIHSLNLGGSTGWFFPGTSNALFFGAAF